MTHSEDGYTVVMPKLGLTMTEATLVEWHVEEGAVVAKDAPLFTLESEKSVLDIEAPASGPVRLLYPAGEVVPVNTPIAIISVSASQRRSEEVAVQRLGDAQDDHESRSTQHAARVRATPKARALARERGLSLEGISGSGPRGMIVVADLEATRHAQPDVRATPVARRVAEQLGVDLACIEGSGPRGAVTRADVEEAAERLSVSASRRLSGVVEEAEVEAQPLRGLRAVIAERMSAGWRERPQVTINMEIDATNLVSARQQLNAELATAGHTDKVSYNAFITLAVARALREFPYVNVQLTEAGLVQMPAINVGLAVDTERGLLVPVVRDADAKDVLTLSRESLDLAQRAIAGRCLPDELSGGVFTVTNLGVYEVDDFTPIINPPESAILGVGRIVPKPVVFEGQVVVRQMMTLSLSFDHRLIDGGPAARFLQRVKHLLERPVALIAFSD